MTSATLRRHITGKLTPKANMNQYSELMPVLTESLLEAFPRTQGGEVEAMVSHWLQAASTEIPFFTPSMHAHCQSLMEMGRPHSSGTSLVRDSGKANQLALPIGWGDIPFPPPKKPRFKFVDLFAGIGGFRIAMQELKGQCVFSSEWDRYAKKTYESNFGEVPYGDIREISEKEIPDHDVLCAGFPCQPFSLAGVSARNSMQTSHGFACETQGTLFFDIVRIIKAKQPKVVFLENVRNLVSHDSGTTFSVIKNAIESLGYSFSYKLINASPLVPQRRVRCYMVCVKGGEKEFAFPKIEGEPLPLKSILQKRVPESFTISSKLWAGHQRRTATNLARGVGFTAFCADLDKPSNTIVARYGKDGKECLIPQRGKNPRMLTPRECARLQGFPEEFVISASKTNAYRQFGNSVAIPVIRKIAEKIIKLI
mgnify:CR=1 FL=1